MLSGAYHRRPWSMRRVTVPAPSTPLPDGKIAQAREIIGRFE